MPAWPRCCQTLASDVWSLTGCLICFSPPQRPHFCLRMCRLTVSAVCPSLRRPSSFPTAAEWPGTCVELSPASPRGGGGAHRSPEPPGRRQSGGAPATGAHTGVANLVPRPFPPALGAGLSGAGPGQPKRSFGDDIKSLLPLSPHGKCPRAAAPSRARGD